MKAIDTSVLVRWITRDDPVQTPISDAILAHPILRAHNRADRDDPGARRPYLPLYAGHDPGGDRYAAGTGYRTIAGEDWIRGALDRNAAGAELPGMIHIIASHGAAALVSVAKNLAIDAGDHTPVVVQHAR